MKSAWAIYDLSMHTIVKLKILHPEMFIFDKNILFILVISKKNFLLVLGPFDLFATLLDYSFPTSVFNKKLRV